MISGRALLSARFDKAPVSYATASAAIKKKKKSPFYNVRPMSRLSIRKYSSISSGCAALDWAFDDLELGGDYLWSIFSGQA